jgi:hypothetical protein
MVESQLGGYVSIMDDKAWGVITVILSIGTIIAPVIFGFAMWKMTRVFVTKETFIDYKEHAEKEREKMQKSLDKIDSNVSELLQRTATRRRS